MKTKMSWTLPLLLICSGSFWLCGAQAINSGDIRGTVTDATGAVIPGASVTVLNVNTGVSKTYTTDASGVYDTSSIVPGTYQVTFSEQGFQEIVRGPITVEVGFTTVNTELKVGSISQKVVVTTNVPLLETESGTQQTTLGAKDMARLPQTGGADWENFMILLPGATGTPNGSQGSSNPGQEISVNGNLPYSNVLADGASTTLSHSQNANPAIFETVAELQISTSSFSAQYGTGGIIFNQISKGGTNHFHGSAYDYFQSDKLNAAGYTFGGTDQVPYVRFNNFGAAVGGPILKDKMFFYFDYDQIVDHGSASNSFNTIPTTAVMGGDFSNSASLYPIYDPTTQTIAHDSQGNPYPVRKSFEQEYGCNCIPTSMFDSVSSKFQQWYPTPANHIPGGNFVTGSPNSEGEPNNNFYSSLPQSTPYRKYFGRFDYQITPNNRLSMSDTQSDTPVIYPSSVTACPIGCESGDVDNNNAQVTDVWNISTRTINEARMGYTWQGNFFADLALNQGYAAQLGWQFAKADDFPAIQFTRNYPYAWIEPSTNAVYKEHVFDPSDVVTMIRGKHILHFGGEMLIYRDDSTAWGNTNAGTMTFSGQYTEQWTVDPSTGIATPNTNSGLEYADFLLGLANTWNANVSPEYGARFKSPQMFVQDDYKMTSNLTVNLGVRYQINHGWNEIRGNESSFDPTVLNPATGTDGAYWYGTTKAGGRDSLMADVYSTVLPRAGFSWLARPNTTLRGGFGLYSYNWSLDNYGGNNTSYGFGAVLGSSGSVSDQTNGITPITQLDGPGNFYGTGTPLPYSQGSTDPANFNGQNVGYIEYHLPVPKIWQWNLQVQQELGTNLVAELGYVGSHAHNLIFPTDLNNIPEANLGSTNPGQYRPYPVFGNISGSTNNAISNYDSLQAEVRKRLTSGVSFDFNYVWSHFLDDQDSSAWGSRGGPQDWQIATDPSANYSNSNFDVRNAFKGYVVYELPFGRGMRYMNHNAFLDELFGGWQTAGTIVMMSGNPFTVYGTQSTPETDGALFPNWNPSVSPFPSHRTARCQAGSGCPNEWYNPSAFLQPANNTFGNVRRNSMYGPGIDQINLSGGKTFHVPWEGMQFELRADATNVFNHASFSPPSVTTLSGSNGAGTPYTYAGQQQIDGTTVGGRSVQLQGRFTF